MRCAQILALVLVCLGGRNALYAQGLPGRTAPLERIIVVLPMVGTGTPDNPRRPLGMPVSPTSGGPRIGYHYVVGDGGHFAIVELTARSVKHFDGPLSLFGAQALHVLDPAKHDRATVERVLKLIRKDFDLDEFLTGFRAPAVQP